MRYFMPAHALPCSEADPSSEQPAPTARSSKRRRGATVMEYLFVISLILTVAITAIGYFGQSTKKTTQQASDAIEKATNGR